MKYPKKQFPFPVRKNHPYSATSDILVSTEGFPPASRPFKTAQKQAIKIPGGKN
jgi:hypothetical protein